MKSISQIIIPNKNTMKRMGLMLWTVRIFSAMIFISTCMLSREIHAFTIKTTQVEYTQDMKIFQGYTAYPPELAQKGKLPAVFIIHEWNGLGEFVQTKANALAEQGYYVFAMDMYGKGIRAKNHKEAAKMSGAYGRNRKLMRSRMKTALNFLLDQPEIDANRITVIGYCFGGMAALELGLMGENVAGIVVLHAIFKLPSLKKEAKNIRGKVLIHHGSADPYVSPAELKNLHSAFQRNKVSYEFIEHKGAKHAFTNNLNKGTRLPGVEYSAEADSNSWASILSFLKNLK